MINNLGKWFYVSDPVEAEKPETHEMLRVVRIREPYEGKVVCDTETDVKVGLSNSNAIGPTVDKDYILRHYTAVTPHLLVYHLSFKDVPAFHSFYIVFEPYDLEDKQAVGRAVDVYPSLSSPITIGSYHTFACHKRMDAVEYFRDMKGYSGAYEVGPLAAIYCNDTPSAMLNLALYDWCKEAPCNTVTRLMEYRNAFAAQAKMPIYPSMLESTNSALSALALQLAIMHSHQLGIMLVSKNEITALRGFVEDHKLEKDRLKALTHILEFEARSKGLSEEEVLKDEVFQRSLIVMPYSMKMDLEQIKSNNPMYTLVLARTTDLNLPAETYVVMYRRAPVEFRQPQQTGFSPDEMSKLLR